MIMFFLLNKYQKIQLIKEQWGGEEKNQPKKFCKAVFTGLKMERTKYKYGIIINNVFPRAVWGCISETAQTSKTYCRQ